MGVFGLAGEKIGKCGCGGSIFTLLKGMEWVRCRRKGARMRGGVQESRRGAAAGVWAVGLLREGVRIEAKGRIEQGRGESG